MTSSSLTGFFDLRLPGLGGRHDGGSGLRDAAGRLLEALQVGAVFVCFHLQTEESRSDGNLLVTTRLNLCELQTRPPTGRRTELTHLGGGYQLSRAGGNFMRAHHQLLELPFALHHQVGRVSATTRHRLEPQLLPGTTVPN